jgi:hypothetical protein
MRILKGFLTPFQSGGFDGFEIFGYEKIFFD